MFSSSLVRKDTSVNATGPATTSTGQGPTRGVLTSLVVPLPAPFRLCEPWIQSSLTTPLGFRLIWWFGMNCVTQGKASIEEARERGERQLRWCNLSINNQKALRWEYGLRLLLGDRSGGGACDTARAVQVSRDWSGMLCSAPNPCPQAHANLLDAALVAYAVHGVGRFYVQLRDALVEECCALFEQKRRSHRLRQKTAKAKLDGRRKNARGPPADCPEFVEAVAEDQEQYLFDTLPAQLYRHDASPGVCEDCRGPRCCDATCPDGAACPTHCVSNPTDLQLTPCTASRSAKKLSCLGSCVRYGIQVIANPSGPTHGGVTGPGPCMRPPPPPAPPPPPRVLTDSWGVGRIRTGCSHPPVVQLWGTWHEHMFHTAPATGFGQDGDSELRTQKVPQETAQQQQQREMLGGLLSQSDCKKQMEL